MKWKGKSLENLDKDELLVCAKYLAKELESWKQIEHMVKDKNYYRSMVYA